MGTSAAAFGLKEGGHRCCRFCRELSMALRPGEGALLFVIGLQPWSPAFLAPGTGVLENSIFSQTRGGGWFQDDSNALRFLKLTFYGCAGVFVAAWGLSRVAASGGSSLVAVHGFSLLRLLLLQGLGSRVWALAVPVWAQWPHGMCSLPRPGIKPVGRQTLSHWTAREVPAHDIYCAPYCYYYCISSTSEQQVSNPGGWGPLAYRRGSGIPRWLAVTDSPWEGPGPQVDLRPELLWERQGCSWSRVQWSFAWKLGVGAPQPTSLLPSSADSIMSKWQLMVIDDAHWFRKNHLRGCARSHVWFLGNPFCRLEECVSRAQRL